MINKAGFYERDWCKFDREKFSLDFFSFFLIVSNSVFDFTNEIEKKT